MSQKLSITVGETSDEATKTKQHSMKTNDKNFLNFYFFVVLRFDSKETSSSMTTAVHSGKSCDVNKESGKQRKNSYN